MYMENIKFKNLEEKKKFYKITFEEFSNLSPKEVENKSSLLNPVKKLNKEKKVNFALDLNDEIYFAEVNNKKVLLKTIDSGNKIIFGNMITIESGLYKFYHEYIWDSENKCYIPTIINEEKESDNFMFEVKKIYFTKSTKNNIIKYGIFYSDNNNDYEISYDSAPLKKFKERDIYEKITSGNYELEASKPNFIVVSNNGNSLVIDYDSNILSNKLSTFNNNDSIDRTNNFNWDSSFKIYINNSKLIFLDIYLDDNNFIFKEKIINGVPHDYENSIIYPSKVKIKLNIDNSRHKKIVFNFDEYLKLTYNFKLEFNVDNEPIDIIFKNRPINFGNQFYSWEENIQGYKNDQSTLFFFEENGKVKCDLYKNYGTSLLSGLVSDSKVSEKISDGVYYSENVSESFIVNNGRISITNNFLNSEYGDKKLLFFYDNLLKGYTLLINNSEIFIIFEKESKEIYKIKIYEDLPIIGLDRRVSKNFNNVKNKNPSKLILILICMMIISFFYYKYKEFKINGCELNFNDFILGKCTVN